MSAAAFAEAGEFDTALEIAGKDKNAHKKILVVLEGDDLNMRILNYASGLCKRLGGQLEILHKKELNQTVITETEVWHQFAEKGGQVVCTTLEPDESLDERLIGVQTEIKKLNTRLDQATSDRYTSTEAAQHRAIQIRRMDDMEKRIDALERDHARMGANNG